MIGLMMASCTDKKVYDAYHHVSFSGWEKNDVISFQPSTIKETSKYQTTLGIRINGQFPFTNLTLIVEQTIYPKENTIIDTLECHLINKDGVPQGHGITLYQYQFPVHQLLLHKNDSLYVTVRHDMKREILPGICDVGLCLSKQ